MKLKDYLYINEIQIKDFAPKVPCSPVLISGYNGKRLRISRGMASLISLATGGEVSMETILSNNPPKKGKSEKQQEESKDNTEQQAIAET